MQFCPVTDRPVILVLYDMMDDARLHFTGYYELCRPDASPGVLCFGNLKLRRENLR